MRVAVVQPSYIPWLGYFYMIANVDAFVYYDNVQYDKHGWRNRNRVMCNHQIRWLTLRINKASLNPNMRLRLIKDVQLYDPNELSKHKHILSSYYPRQKAKLDLDDLYKDNVTQYSSLADCIIAHNKNILQILDIHTPTFRASELSYSHDRSSSSEILRNVNLVSLLKTLGATEYVSGISAKSYLNQDLFKDNDIKLIWNNFIPQSNVPLSIAHHLLAEGTAEVLKLICNASFSCGF